MLAVAADERRHHRRRARRSTSSTELRRVEPATASRSSSAASTSRRSTRPSGDTLAVIPIADDGPGVDQHASTMPGAVRDAGLERAREPRPRRSATTRGRRADGLRRRAPRQRGLRRRRAAVRAGRAPRSTRSRSGPSTDRGQALAFARGRPGRVDRRAAARRPRGACPACCWARSRPGSSTCSRGSSSRAAASGVSPAALVLVEGMLFANSRIAMNDVYVTTFILARRGPLHARLHWRRPAPLEGRRRCSSAPASRSGLALASKWVALYAIGGLVLLVLLRSALGRRHRARRHSSRSTAVLGASRSAPPDDRRPEPQLDVPRAHAPAHDAPRGRHRAAAAALSRAARSAHRRSPCRSSRAWRSLAGSRSSRDAPLLDGARDARRGSCSPASRRSSRACVVGSCARRRVVARRRRARAADGTPPAPAASAGAWLTPGARRWACGWLFTLGVPRRSLPVARLRRLVRALGGARQPVGSRELSRPGDDGRRRSPS